MRLIHILLLMSLLLTQVTHAQDKLGVVSLFKNNREGQRKALVMANQTYTHQTSLKNTLRDADSMAVALRYLGFDLMLVTEKNFAQTSIAINQFVASLQPGDVVFVYFSGHGMGYQRDNYLITKDFLITEDAEIPHLAISTNNLRTRITRRKVRNLFMVVDACRNEADTTDKGGDTDPYRLVEPDENPPGTLEAFATNYGQTATFKSRNNRNSLYTESLLLYLRQPLEVQEIFRLTNNRTHAESKRLKLRTQHPVYTPMIYDDFYFLKRYTSIAPPQPNVPTTDLPVGPAMVRVEGGTFMMGSNENDNEKPIHQVTVSSFLMGKYEVTVGEFAEFVEATSYRTDAEKEGGSYVWKASTWKKEVGVNWRCDTEGNVRDRSSYNHSVIHVSHNDAMAYCTWLSRKLGRTYRLPTEAEWEYAAGGGAGNRTRFGNGKMTLDPVEANFDGSKAYKKLYSVAGKYRGKPVAVGSFAPNGLGLYDMVGNVWEWCGDWYDASYYVNSSSINPTGPSSGASRVLRGGSFGDDPQNCRVAYRISRSPSTRNESVGFRVLSQLQ